MPGHMKIELERTSCFGALFMFLTGIFSAICWNLFRRVQWPS